MLDKPDEATAFGGGGFGERVDERERHLALTDVLAGGLAGPVAFAKVEEVVLNLEGEAHAFAEAPHLLDRVVVGACRGGPAGAAGREERGGFAANDVEVDLLGDVEASGFFDLEEFALAHFAHGARGDLQQVKRLDFDRSEQAARQQVVSNKHGDLFLPERLDAEHATSKGAFVDHVIVHQGGRVQELDQGRGGVRAVCGGTLRVDPTVEPGAEKHKHGPHLLAFAAKDVAHDRVEQGDVGGDGRPEFGLEGRHVSS